MPGPAFAEPGSMLATLVTTLSLAFGPTILDLSLHIDDAARQSLLTSPDTDAAATLTCRTEGGDTTYAVTIHVKGQLGSARSVDDKPAFKIKLAKGEQFLGLERLTLNNMVQDPTMLHEALGYQVYAAAGVTVPNSGYVRLTVDGQDYGLYLNVETIDPLFLERRFGDRHGILYEGAYGVDLRSGDEERFELHEGRDPGHARLTALVRAVEAPGDGVFYGSTAQVDTTSFLAMMAAEAMLADWDNYYASNNYRIYWSPPAARWFFIPTGIDQTFGGDSTTLLGAAGALLQKCLASDRCTNDYATMVGEVAARFERLGLSNRMDALLSVIGPASQADPRRPYDDETMRRARESMRGFIATQPSRVRAELSCLSAEGGSVMACGGAVLVNAGLDACLEPASRTRGQQRSGARVARCVGGAKQRWRLVPASDAFELVAVSSGICLHTSTAEADSETFVFQAACSVSDGELFSRRDLDQGIQFVAIGSGQCLAVAAGDSKTPAVVQRPCAADPTQYWRLQRSVFR